MSPFAPEAGDVKVQAKEANEKESLGGREGERIQTPNPAVLGKKPDNNHNAGQGLHLHPTRSSRHVQA